MAIVLRGRTTIPVRCPGLSPLFLTLTQTPGMWGYSSHFGTRQSAALMRTRRITQVPSFHILAHAFALFCTPGGGTLARHSSLRSSANSASPRYPFPFLPVPPCPPYSLASARLSSTIAALPSGGEMSFRLRFDEIRTGFERPFWVANITELFERLSYYAVFASLARYLHEVLNFPTERATNLTGLFGGLVWFLAIFGGAAADRLGFRRALSLAYLILAGSYFLLGSIGS